jgi:vitamin B12 transporter
MLSIRFAVSAALAASSVVTAASAAEVEPVSATLTDVVVTATRTPTPMEDVLSSVTVITHEELARSAIADISEALRFQAGIDVARTGGIGQTTSVFIRGTESNHTLVLLDGVRINPGTVGVAAIQNIPPELIERIEIVKGPRSSLYGSDAIGGVINIITRAAPDKGAFGEVQIGVGSFNTDKVSGLIELGNSTVSGGFSVAEIESDGFPAKDTSTIDSSYDNLTIGANLRANMGPVSASVRHLQSEGSAAYLSFFGAPLDQDFDNAVTALVVDVKATEAWTTSVTASHMRDRIQQNQPVSSTNRDYLDTRRDLVDWQNEIRIGDANRVVAGAMYSKESARTKAFSTFETDTEVLNLYLQDQFTSGRHSAQLAAGFTDHETSGQHVTWNAEYGFAITDNTQVIASAGTAFRAPDATDRYGFGGNPDLEPEESESFELAYRLQLAANQAVQISAYQNEIDNLISYDNNASELRNLDRARIRGIEASYTVNGESWRVNAAANVQNPRDLGTDALLLRRARESFSLGYVQKFGPIEIGADVSLVGPRDDFGFPDNIELDSYSLVNIHARYFVTKELVLAANVENLFDEQYELANGYNTADQSVFVSIRYTTR